ncbi:hypothetical protein FACS1894198_1780 [Clostridia bacterium]|nr:hypothetical protein FACS1894198_1780 [Clostridia bacterium]
MLRISECLESLTSIVTLHLTRSEMGGFMDYIKRDIEKIILEASESYAAILVTGPRQVGKTTTL